MRQRGFLFVAGTAVVVFMALVGALAPWIAPQDPDFVPQGQARLPPGSGHVFGTDQIGRDVLSRVVFGARTSLTVGVSAALLASIVGVAVGVSAGWCRGRLDFVSMRCSEVFLAIPGVLSASALLVVFGRGIVTVVIVLAATSWPLIARVTRAETLRVAESGFVEASRIGGASQLRTLGVHVLPHVLPVAASLCVTGVGVAILAEASLSFLGIGITEPDTSWGSMIADARRFLVPSPHMIVFPSAALFVTMCGFTMIAFGLRRALHLESR